MTSRVKLISIISILIVTMVLSVYFPTQALAAAHPGGLHSQLQISITKQKIEQNMQPWENAYNELISRANGYLSHSSQAVEDFYAPGYYSDPEGSLAAKILIQGDGVAAYTLALSYQLDDGIDRTLYADKAVELLNSWATINKTVSGVDGPEYMCTGGIGLIHAADLVWNYDGWNVADRDNFTDWVNSVFQGAANAIIGESFNWGCWGTMASISAAYLVDDQETVDHVIELIKNRIRDTIESDGHLPYETRYGAKGLWYTYYALAPLTAACQVALNASGVDLFHYTSPNGRNIKMALDCLFYYSEHPDEWPYYDGELSSIPKPHSWPGNLFMAMAAIYNCDDYKNWVTSLGPVYDSTWWAVLHIAWYFPVLMQPLPAQDTTPPVRSDGQPTGTLLSGTTEITMSLTTDEPATCRYSTVPGTSYDSMTDTFSTTGGMSHSTLVTGLSDGCDYTFYVRCADSAGNQNTNDFLISFSVASPGATPLAVDDAYSVNQDTTLAVEAPGVLDNDSDGDGDLLTAILVDGVGNGVLALNADGSFSYTPAFGYIGNDGFTYVAHDGLDDSNIATVTITVNASGPPPGETATFGLDSGNNTWGEGANIIDGMKFECAYGGTLTKLSLLVDDASPGGNVKVAIYDHDGAHDLPENLLWGSGSTAVHDGLMEWGTAPVELSADTTYWLVYWMDARNGIRYQSGAGRHVWWFWTYGDWPGAFDDSARGSNNNQYVMQATLIIE